MSISNRRELRFIAHFAINVLLSAAWISVPGSRFADAAPRVYRPATQPPTRGEVQRVREWQQQPTRPASDVSRGNSDRSVNRPTQPTNSGSLRSAVASKSTNEFAGPWSTTKFIGPVHPRMLRVTSNGRYPFAYNPHARYPGGFAPNRYPQGQYLGGYRYPFGNDYYNYDGVRSGFRNQFVYGPRAVGLGLTGTEMDAWSAGYTGRALVPGQGAIDFARLQATGGEPSTLVPGAVIPSPGPYGTPAVTAGDAYDIAQGYSATPVFRPWTGGAAHYGVPPYGSGGFPFSAGYPYPYYGDCYSGWDNPYGFGGWGYGGYGYGGWGYGGYGYGGYGYGGYGYGYGMPWGYGGLSAWDAVAFSNTGFGWGGYGYGGWGGYGYGGWGGPGWGGGGYGWGGGGWGGFGYGGFGAGYSDFMWRTQPYWWR